MCMQALTEVYMTNDIEVQPHMLLSLVLCKLGDSSQVRSLHLHFGIPLLPSLHAIRYSMRTHASAFCCSLSPWAVLLQEVRDDALKLLDTLSTRVWRESGKTVASLRPGTPLLPGQILHASPHAAVVIGALQDSFQDFQLRLSSKLAR